MPGWLKPLLLLATPMAILGLGPWLGLPQLVKTGLAWVETLGPWGPLAYMTIYVGVVVAGMPVGPMVAAGGLLFGAAWGLLWVSLGGLVGASIAFGLARGLARREAQAWLADQPAWIRLEPLLHSHAGPIVAVARMLPGVPFSLSNYAFGLSGIPFATYLPWTAVGMLPLGALTVVGAEAYIRFLSEGRVSAWLLGAGLALAVLVLLLTRWARNSARAR